MNQTDQLLSDLRVDCEYSTLQVLSLRNNHLQPILVISRCIPVMAGMISYRSTFLRLNFDSWFGLQIELRKPLATFEGREFVPRSENCSVPLYGSYVYVSSTYLLFLAQVVRQGEDGA